MVPETEFLGWSLLLEWMRTARRGRLLIGSIEASVLTSTALPSGRAIWRAYMRRPTVLTVSIRLAGEPRGFLSVAVPAGR